MENLTREQTLVNHYTQLQGMGAFIDKAIEDQIGIVHAEFENYIDCLTCYDTMHHNILDLEARFEHALVNLKFLVGQKMRDKCKEKTPWNLIRY